MFEEEHDRLILSFKALGGGLWDYDIDDDRLVCNDRWYQILGLDEKISPITSISDFQPYIHPDDVLTATEVDLMEVALLIENDERYYNEFRIVRPTGEVRRIRSIACVIEDQRTGHRRAVGCITDLTDSDSLDQGLTRWPMRARSAPPGGLADNPLRQVSNKDKLLTETLSGHEIECLSWVSLGKTAGETGKILGKSRRTVEFHINNAVRKLDASNKIHATVIAIREGIL